MIFEDVKGRDLKPEVISLQGLDLYRNDVDSKRLFIKFQENSSSQLSGAFTMNVSVVSEWILPNR
ncbi:hypothetical protein SynMEDNS5_01067 [Synechococcus sp. MEDNS5]|nr:hypothetical protein SynMEDNS5_01067 [Synechococcus sp. MEDNS5]